MKSESESAVRGFSKPQREFPCNFRTSLFCFLVGSILSVPCGLVLAQRQFFPAPEWTRPIYFAVVLGSMVILPIWSFVALRDQPGLRWAAFNISFAAFLLLIIGALIPALG